jgi:hypothetical protein
MVYVTDSPAKPDPDAWVFEHDNYCRECGTKWRLDRNDKEAPLWRWFVGFLPRPKTFVLGPGITTQAMYIVKRYPAETGISGTYMTTRCPECGAYAMRRKP